MYLSMLSLHGVDSLINAQQFDMPIFVSNILDQNQNMKEWKKMENYYSNGSKNSHDGKDSAKDQTSGDQRSSKVIIAENKTCAKKNTIFHITHLLTYGEMVHHIVD